MDTLRTPETQSKYDAYKKTADRSRCVLCDKPSLSQFTHWRIVENSFPYDRIAAVHHMLIPIRHCIEPELSDEELAELKELKESVVSTQYEFMVWSAMNIRSVPDHYHLHLIVSSHMFDYFRNFHENKN